MAEVKWIKIVTDIFDDEKVELIEAMPDGDSILVIWFKILCLAGKQNNSGVLMLTDRIAYTDEMLATIFRRPVNTIRLALSVFEAYEMIEIIEGAITIPNWSKHQSLDKYEEKKKSERERKAIKRAEQKMIAESVRDLSADMSAECPRTSPEDVRGCPPIEEDKEEDIYYCAELNPQLEMLLPPPTEMDAIARCAAKRPTKPKSDKPTDDSPVILEMPCTDGPDFPITQKKVDEWAQSYPGVDVVAQLKRARQWLIDNPRKAKTRRGMTAFLGNWLSREQDAASRYRNQAPKPPDQQQRKGAEWEVLK